MLVCHGCTWWWCNTFNKCGMIRDKIPTGELPYPDRKILPKRQNVVPPIQEYQTPKRRYIIYKRDGYKCVICDSKEQLSLDHIIPRSKGGSNEEENLQTMCVRCNGIKADRIISNEQLKKEILV